MSVDEEGRRKRCLHGSLKIEISDYIPDQQCEQKDERSD